MTHPHLSTDRYYDSINIEPDGEPEMPGAPYPDPKEWPTIIGEIVDLWVKTQSSKRERLDAIEDVFDILGVDLEEVNAYFHALGAKE